ncbi:hypothetical protein NMG60_11035278 [Bertholletia excelsa]
MQLTGALSLLLFCLLLSTTHGHNITRILAKHPELSTFNHYLTITHLASEINRRQTITVCAIDNTAMNALLAKHLPLYTVRNVLSLHVFADYFGSKKLHEITKGSTTTATLFQATGEASGTSGYVNITDSKGGKVSFSAVDAGEGIPSATYVKSVEEKPYNISVIQISHVLSSVDAEAPVAGPSEVNLTTLMAKQGCKAFSDLLTKSGAEDTFKENVDGGLTVFCPSDEALDSFMPKYKNLTAAGKTSLVLYHGVPVYQSLQMLRSNNGLMNTLATDGAKKFDFTVQNDGEDVKLETKVVTATITGTLIDEEPVVVYKIDKVLMPRELFKEVEEVDAPSPAPTKKPKAKGKGKTAKSDPEEADAPAPDGSEDDAADSTADNNGAGRVAGGWLVTACVSVGVGILALL